MSRVADKFCLLQNYCQCSQCRGINWSKWLWTRRASTLNMRTPLKIYSSSVPPKTSLTTESDRGRIQSATDVFIQRLKWRYKTFMLLLRDNEQIKGFLFLGTFLLKQQCGLVVFFLTDTLMKLYTFVRNKYLLGKSEILSKCTFDKKKHLAALNTVK